jgi:hypothetical protein
MVDPNNWYQSKVRLGVAAVAEGALVVAGGVMAFVGSSGGEVVGPCVGLCVVDTECNTRYRETKWYVHWFDCDESLTW